MMVLIWAHNRRMIEKNDIPNIISLVKEYISCVETESVDTFSDKYGLSVLASKEEIAENDYVLVGDRYKNNLPLDCEYEMVQLGDTRYFCLGSASSPVDLSKLPLNDLYPDIISAIAQNPDMLSSLGANISTENIDKLKQLNDVMKSNSLIEKLEKVSIMGGFDGIKLKAELEDTRKKLIPIAEKLKESMNKQFAITCFSKISNSILMWSHYANKHTGFCVGYNFEKCRNWDALINLLPVLYSVERPSLPMGLIDFSNPKEIKLNNISDYVPELMMLLLSKSNKWDYEEEWRIVNHQSQLIDAHLLDLHTISHIYLGANISKDNEYLIRDVAKKLTIPISKYRISPDKYQLEIEG